MNGRINDKHSGKHYLPDLVGIGLFIFAVLPKVKQLGRIHSF